MILESPKARRLLDSLPARVQERYEAWKSIFALSGSAGLNAIRSFRAGMTNPKTASVRRCGLGDGYVISYRYMDGDCLVESVEAGV